MNSSEGPQVYTARHSFVYELAPHSDDSLGMIKRYHAFDVHKSLILKILGFSELLCL